jgi:hypothetical protein
MLVKSKYSFPMVVIMGMMALNLFSQPTLTDSVSKAFEQIYFVTDRAVYAVDETIYFKVSNQASFQGSNVGWSNIVYCEIITPDGNSIAKVKTLVTDNIGSGELKIPSNAFSGNYYLRVYTKWMLNQSPNSFAYKSITIINPFTKEVLTNAQSSEAEMKFTPMQIAPSPFISLVISDSTFKTNKEVEFQIQANSDIHNPTEISVAVVGKGLSNKNRLFVEDIKNRITEVKYIPETRGVSLSGKVINKFDSLPVPFADVWISLLAEKPVVREALTDKDGNFYFDLGKEEGSYELNISVITNKTDVEPILFVDNDYSTSKVNLPYIPFEIPEQDRDMFETMAINSQLQRIYGDRKVVDSLKFSFENNFYGKPDNTIKFNQYVDLPTIEDYIKDLIPNLYLRKEDAKQYFKIYSSLPDMALNKPLVMVNMIKFNDAKDILKLSPKLIDRVELITVPFIRGEMIYGGIIHFITKSANYTEFDFKAGSVLIDFDMIGPNDSVNFTPKDTGLPKIGNCLYWNPSLKISNQKNTTIRFNTGTEPGEFELVIEGLDQNLKPFQVRKCITIL